MEDRIKELKARAYDCISQIEMWQSELKSTNEEIIKLSKSFQIETINQQEEQQEKEEDKEIEEAEIIKE